METGALVLAAIAVIAVLVLIFKRRGRPHTVDAVHEPAVSFGPELGRFVGAYTSAPDESSPEYRAALEGLKTNARKVVEEIERLDRELAPHAYAVRRALVFAVSAMRDTAGLNYLRRLALRRDLPQAGSPHMATDAEEETMISLIAVEGLEKLAADANPEATEALVVAMNVPSLAVRAVALEALRASDGTGRAYQRAVAMLPADQQYLRNVRRTKVSDVPQVRDPRRHLLGPVRNIAGPPVLPEDAKRFEPRPKVKGRGDAPGAGRK